MEILEALLLGILQGVTEFLPVSSSGHLVLAQELLKRDLDRGITFEVVVHFGSLFSILIYYRKRVADILISLFHFFMHPGKMGENWKEQYDVKISVYILISMIPAGIVGFTLKNQLEYLFQSPVLVSCALLVTGFILYTNKYTGSSIGSITMGKGFIIGLAQALAMIPGISRSGTTISTGAILGIKRDQIAEFSFIMLLPVLAGAMILEAKEMTEIGVDTAKFVELTVAFLASLISGYLSLKYLIRIFKSQGLHYFAYYVWTIGVLGIVWFGFIH